MFNQFWQVTFFFYQTLSVRWILLCCEELSDCISELFTASDRWPTYHNAADNRQWSRSRICKRPCPQWSWVLVVWSVPLTTSRCLSANHNSSSSSEISVTYVLGLNQQHGLCWTRWKYKLHNCWNYKNLLPVNNMYETISLFKCCNSLHLNIYSSEKIGFGNVSGNCFIWNKENKYLPALSCTLAECQYI